jgi:Domain of unknown function (DUF222)
MFEDVEDLADRWELDAIDPDVWEPIPAAELASIGAWCFPEDPDLGIPAGFDDWILQSQLHPVDDHTLAVLNATPHEQLSREGLSLKLVQLCAVATYVDLLRADVTAVIAGPRPTTARERLDDFAAHEVAVATRSSVYAADRQIWLARDLTSRLVRTADAMRRGEITAAQATALSEATSQLDPDVAQQIEDRMLRYSHRQDLTLFRASLRRWVAKLDPDFTTKAKAARAEVEVTHTAFADGTGQLYIRGPLELTTTIHMAMTAHAAKTKHELGGTIDQRKLAGLRDWAEQAWNAPDTPRHHGRLPTVNLLFNATAMLGLNDEPAVIPGVGAVPADVARWLIADGAPIRKMLIDPITGQLLDYGTQTYTVPPGLADYLIARHITSASPHSNTDARNSDMEHNRPHDQGGATNPMNVTPVDRRWHRAKTHAGWTYQKDDQTGVVTWTSPTGLTCQIDPYDYR